MAINPNILLKKLEDNPDLVSEWRLSRFKEALTVAEMSTPQIEDKLIKIQSIKKSLNYKENINFIAIGAGIIGSFSSIVLLIANIAPNGKIHPWILACLIASVCLIIVSKFVSANLNKVYAEIGEDWLYEPLDLDDVWTIKKIEKSCKKYKEADDYRAQQIRKHGKLLEADAFVIVTMCKIWNKERKLINKQEKELKQKELATSINSTSLMYSSAPVNSITN